MYSYAAVQVLTCLASWSQLCMHSQVFFKEILLFILENPSSPFEQKLLAIQALSRICADPQSVIDLYLNYDCDLSMYNVFERLVNVLTKVAQGRSKDAESGAGGVPLPAAGALLSPSQMLRVKSLECLVNILSCMVEWSKELYVNPQSHSNLGKEASSASTRASVSEPPGADAGAGAEKLLHRRSESVVSDSVLSTNSSASRPTGLASIADNPAELESIKAQKALLEAGIDKYACTTLRVHSYSL